MDSLLEDENAEAPQEGALVPIVALGAAGVRVARELSERLDGLALLEIADAGREGAAPENVPELDLPADAPIRYVLYDRAEVGADFVQAVAAQARADGKVIAFEIAAQGEKRAPSWLLGVDVLIRVADEAECLAAAEMLLPMAAPHGLISVDADDVLALFGGADVVHVGIGTATGAQAVNVAVEQALGALVWKPEFLRGILLSITGNENLGMKEIDAATTAIMERASKDCNIVFGAEVDPTIGDDVRVTILATCGKRKDSHDASEWMMEMLEEKFATDDNR